MLSITNQSLALMNEYTHTHTYTHTVRSMRIGLGSLCVLSADSLPLCILDLKPVLSPGGAEKLHTYCQLSLNTLLDSAITLIYCVPSIFSSPVFLPTQNPSKSFFPRYPLHPFFSHLEPFTLSPSICPALSLLQKCASLHRRVSLPPCS